MPFSLSAFLADKWVHVLIVGLVAAAPAAASAAGFPLPTGIDTLLTLLAGGTAAHAGLTHF